MELHIGYTALPAFSTTSFFRDVREKVFRTDEDDGCSVHRYFRDFCYHEDDLLIGFCRESCAGIRYLKWIEDVRYKQTISHQFSERHSSFARETWRGIWVSDS